MNTSKTPINRALGEMRKRPDGKVVGDPGLKTEDIQRYSGVSLEIVRTVLRHLPILDRYDSAELLKLAKYLLSEAAKKRTPLENHTLLADNAATIQSALDARAAEQARREATLVERVPSRGEQPSPAPATLAGLAKPSGIKGTHLAAPTAIERAQQSVKLAKTWLDIRRAEWGVVAREDPAVRDAWAQQSLQESELHLGALKLVKSAVHGSAGATVRMDAVRALAALTRFIEQLK